ncbi:MAG: Gfo/Idh/MocA family oxidoreductase [Deltaproteobacteria bacterium]|nr:Gfo/Idh/MocA family oxidoreductase [Deltaproteobacteria bacterium]
MRILQVGLGRWGQNHLQTWRQLGVELRLCDEDPKLLEGAAEPASRDYRDFLAEVDAVDVVTPAPAHASLVHAALEAGKHVLVEKPLTPAAKDGFALHAEAVRRGLVLQVGHVFRFTPEAQAIASVLASGEIGPVRYAVARFASLKRPRTDGGIAISDGVHFVDLLSWLFGRQPEAVTATLRDHLGRGLDDVALLALDYGDVLGVVEASCFPPEPQRDLEIMGVEGALRADLLAKAGRLRVYRQHHVRDAHGDWQVEAGQTREVAVSGAPPLAAELREFIAACEAGAASRIAADGWDGAAATAVLEAAAQSAREGRRVSIELPDRVGGPR